MSNAAKNCDILATGLSVLHNYFDSSTKLLYDLYPAKILDLSAKPFFLCKIFLISNCKFIYYPRSIIISHVCMF